jgi:hypothetical protein
MLEFDVKERGFREELNQFPACSLSSETTVLLSRYNHGAFLAVDRYVLRALFYGPTHNLAEARLGVLKLPVVGIASVGNFVCTAAGHGCAHHLVSPTRQ